MNPLTPDNRLAAWRKAQGHDFADQMDADVRLGPYYADQWLRDPKHLLFGLARYKFVAKMLQGEGKVAEIGAGDGWASELVRRAVESLTLYDLSPLHDGIRKMDIAKDRVRAWYDAVYALDVVEHIEDGETVFSNLAALLTDHGKLIVGIPSLESQKYASEPSRKLHVNCMTGEDLRVLALKFFRHVFMFAQNDEVVHTGFLPMAHYLFAVCAEPAR